MLFWFVANKNKIRVKRRQTFFCERPDYCGKQRHHLPAQGKKKRPGKLFPVAGTLFLMK
jgi:hypothetical protein